MSRAAAAPAPAPAAAARAPKPAAPAPAPAPPPAPKIADRWPELATITAALAEAPAPPAGTVVAAAADSSVGSVVDHEPDVSVPVRIAATMIVLVVALQLLHVRQTVPAVQVPVRRVRRPSPTLAEA